MQTRLKATVAAASNDVTHLPLATRHEAFVLGRAEALGAHVLDVLRHPLVLQALLHRHPLPGKTCIRHDTCPTSVA